MRKTNLAFIIGFIVCFAAAYRGMVFSPSFTMMYVVAGMGLCILGEILDMAQAGKRFGSREQKLIVKQDIIHIRNVLGVPCGNYLCHRR